MILVMKDVATAQKTLASATAAGLEHVFFE